MALIELFKLQGQTNGGSIDTITVDDGGTAYTAPTISFTGGGGSGATATAAVALGVITGITVTNGGSGYLTAPTVVITDDDGADAEATANMDEDSEINTVEIERHSDGSWRFETENGTPLIYDGQDSKVNALLETVLFGANGLPDPADLDDNDDDAAAAALFGNTGVA